MTTLEPSATLTLSTLLTLTYSPAGLEYTFSALLLWALALVANPLTYLVLGLVGTLAYLFVLYSRLGRLTMHHRDTIQLLNSIISSLVARREARLAGLRREMERRMDEAWRRQGAEFSILVEEMVEATRQRQDAALDDVEADAERKFASLMKVLRLHEGIVGSLEHNLEMARRLLRGGDEVDDELRMGDDVEAFWPWEESQDGGRESGDGLDERPEEAGIDVGAAMRLCEEWLEECWEVEEMEDVE